VLDISEVLQRGRMLPMAAQGVAGTAGGNGNGSPTPAPSEEPAGQA
jgi:hypothetical protein